jgi:hypothetical protein
MHRSGARRPLPRRAKHIELKYHFVRELVDSKQIKLEPCDTNDMAADIFTKALGSDKHQKFVKMLGMREHSK